MTINYSNDVFAHFSTLMSALNEFFVADSGYTVTFQGKAEVKGHKHMYFKVEYVCPMSKGDIVLDDFDCACSTQHVYIKKAHHEDIFNGNKTDEDFYNGMEFLKKEFEGIEGDPIFVPSSQEGLYFIGIVI